MNENPALKKLVVCFSALVLPYVIYQIVISGGEPKPLIALAMGGNILPAEILSEYQKYKKAGKDA